MALADLLNLARAYGSDATAPAVTGVTGRAVTGVTGRAQATGYTPAGQKSADNQRLTGRVTGVTGVTGNFGVFQGSEGSAQPAAEPAPDPGPDWWAGDPRWDDRPPEPPPPLPPAGPPSDELVERLALALAARPGHRITGPKAMDYFRSEARRRLSLQDDDLARGLLVGAERYRHVQPEEPAGPRLPASWWDAQPNRPAAGGACSCCGGRRWWSRDERSWCCARCHPAPVPNVIEVQT